jgi:hypothetical protein
VSKVAAVAGDLHAHQHMEMNRARGSQFYLHELHNHLPLKPPSVRAISTLAVQRKRRAVCVDYLLNGPSVAQVLGAQPQNKISALAVIK